MMDVVTLQAAKADARKRYGTGLRAFGGLVPVGDKASPCVAGVNLSNGTDTGGNSRVKHNIHVPTDSLVLVYANWYGNGTSGETDGPNDITVRASIELGDGTFLPVRFGGARDVTIKAGGTVVSDPIGVGHAGPTGTYAYVFSRTFVTCTSGGKWPNTTICDNLVRAGEGVQTGTAQTDLTTSGAITTNRTYAYGPVAVLGVTPTRNSPVVVVVGDSRAAGLNDTDTNNGGIKVFGYISRALQAAHIPHIKVANPSEWMANFRTKNLSARRRPFLSGATDIYCQYGINDARNGQTLAQLQVSAIGVWQELAQTRARVWQDTLPPATTSTDSWATTANQTAGTGEAIRAGFNDWLRDGAPMNAGAAVAVGTVGASRCAYYNAVATLATAASGAAHPLNGVFEVADTVESARNSGFWKVDGTANKYTSDGLHASTAGHVLAQAAIPTSVFT